ncbi:MAG: polyprenyl synthetase family protein [Dehalococcoidia bacterium]|nr:polyprenyl synthetase family protein [Dehalococcoidia bacterium]
MTGELEASIQRLSSLVLHEIRDGLRQSICDRNLRRLVLEPIMAQAGSRRSPVLRRSYLTLVVCRSLCGMVDSALPAAAAVEFFYAALDVFDDIEDQDAGDALWTKYGQAPALNAATALLMLAQVAVARLRLRGVGPEAIARSMEAIASSGVAACAGQHRDLAYEASPLVSEAAYFKMVGMKSASLVECACKLGASAAGAAGPVADAFSHFGHYLGVASQISNDVQSLSINGSTKSDIVRRKKTLPLVFALSYAEPRDREWLDALYRSDNPIDSATESRVLEILRRCGAIRYSVVRTELYRGKAVSALRKANLPDSAIGEIRSALSV